MLFTAVVTPTSTSLPLPSLNALAVPQQLLPGFAHTPRVSPDAILHAAVPRKAAGDVRAYERVETEPGLDKFVDDAKGKASLCDLMGPPA